MRHSAFCLVMMLAVIAAVSIAASAVAAPAAAQVTTAVDGDRITLENGQLRAVIDVHGGRVASLVNKKTGKDLIPLWKGGQEIGGALDDRLVFTSTAYRMKIVQAGGDQGSVLLETNEIDGVSISKTIFLQSNEPTLRVKYTHTNGSQLPSILWLRNFFVPGGSPLTDHHLYILPLADGIQQKPFASEYFPGLRAPWAALYNTETKEGLLAAVPGLEKFYFWQGSRDCPTFEWLYPETPAGQRFSTEIALTLINDASPDWAALADSTLASVPKPKTEAVAGWIGEMQRFKVTADERKRGYWLSTGRDKGKQRLPEKLDFDLPLEEERAAYISLSALKDMSSTPLSVRIEGPVSDCVHAGIEAAEKDLIAVDALTDGPVSLKNGKEQRLWLLMDSRGKKPGTYAGSLTLTLGDKVIVPLSVQIWPLRVPEIRPFDVRGYTSFGSLTGGADVTPDGLRRMEVLCKAYAGFGGNVFDWTVGWPAILAHVKAADTGELLADRVNKPMPLDVLPHLDFSYFNPWSDVAAKNGMKRIETYLELGGGGDKGTLDAAVGKDRVIPDTPEAKKVMVWLLTELKTYFDGRGFRGFFCKISDEIFPDSIAAYTRAAEVARQGGWRPFTTITGLIARDPALINAMAPHCDQWQLSVMMKEDFWGLTTPPSTGKVPAAIKPNDEVWFYGGLARPFETSYDTAAVYPMLAAVDRVKGYGFWAFAYPGTETILWYNATDGSVRLAPSYLGLRDGWRDACLFQWAVRGQKAIPEDQVVSEKAGAILHIGQTSSEVYRWRTITNLDSPMAFNRLRSELLKAVAKLPTAAPK